MFIFLDVDGVILDFEKSFIRFIGEHCQIDIDAAYRPQKWDFSDLFATKEQLYSYWNRFINSPYAATMSALIEPRLLNLATRECSVHLLTNFPGNHMDKRLLNLSRLGFNFEALHYCGFEEHNNYKPLLKSALINKLFCNQRGIFVDDHFDNCKDVYDNCTNVEVWMMDRPSNKDYQHDGIRRAYDWKELLKRIEKANQT